MTHRDRHVRPNAEPGTGTQYYTEASPPCGCRGEQTRDECGDINHEYPNRYHLDGRKWKVGHDYLDIKKKDVVELTAVVRKSSWCDTREPDNGTLMFRLRGERVGGYELQAQRRAHDMELTERLIERHTDSNRKPGAPVRPW